LGLALGPLLAALITSENWRLFAVIVPLLIPIVILVNKYPFSALIIWMVVMPWFPFQGMYKYLYFTVHRMLIPLSLGLIILFRMLRLKEYRPIRLMPAELATVAFLVMGLISIIVTGSHWKTVFNLQDQFLVPFAAYWLVRLSNAQEQQLRQLIPVMLLLTIAQGTIGLVSWFAPAVLPSIWISGRIGSRTMGTFGQPAIYACILLLFLVCFYHDAMNRKKGRWRTLEIATFILVLVCVFFTFTRGAWFTGIVVLLGLLFLYPKVTGSLIAVMLPLAIVVSTGLLAGEVAHTTERLNSTEEGGEARLVLANAGKNMFYAKPVLGWGYSRYDRYDWRFLERVGEFTPTKWQIEKGTSHHTYLTILAEMGVVGFFFYALPIFWWLLFTFKAVLHLPKEGFWSWRLLIALWLPIVAHIMIAQDLDMRFFYYCLTLFWVNLGFIANMVQTSLYPDDLRVT